MINLNKPLCSIDIETTGVNTETDRVVSLGVYKVSKIEKGIITSDSRYWLFNPEQTIPKNVEKLIGISNEDVRGCPIFSQKASEFLSFIEGGDLLGFNLRSFDCLVLMKEMERAGFLPDAFPDPNANIVDSGVIFKLKEKRTLEAAAEKYAKRKHEGAHNALADATMTFHVLIGQLNEYADLAQMDVAGLAEFSKYEGAIDLAGKLKLDEDGDACFTFGKVKDQKVKNNFSFACWMLKSDFPNDTKRHLTRILDEIRKNEEF